MGRLITWELQLELQYDWQVKILFYNLVDIILESVLRFYQDSRKPLCWDPKILLLDFRIKKTYA